jgi:hypothetical protein
MTLKAHFDIILYLSADKSEPVCAVGAFKRLNVPQHCRASPLFSIYLHSSHTLIGVIGLRIQFSITIYNKLNLFVLT